MSKISRPWEEESGSEERRSHKAAKRRGWEESDSDGGRAQSQHAPEFCDTSDDEDDDGSDGGEGGDDELGGVQDDEDIDGFEGVCHETEEEEEPDWHKLFIRFVVELLLLRVLNARQFCVIMWYAAKASITSAGPYGLHPQARSSHYCRKVKRKIGLYTDANMYAISAPGRKKGMPGRRKVNIKVHPPHEIINQYITETPTVLDDVKESVDGKKLPDCYYTNPLVLKFAHLGLVLPLGCFVDAVPYSLIDSCIGFWFI